MRVASYFKRWMIMKFGGWPNFATFVTVLMEVTNTTNCFRVSVSEMVGKWWENGKMGGKLRDIVIWLGDHGGNMFFEKLGLSSLANGRGFNHSKGKLERPHCDWWNDGNWIGVTTSQHSFRVVNYDAYDAVVLPDWFFTFNVVLDFRMEVNFLRGEQLVNGGVGAKKIVARL